MPHHPFHPDLPEGDSSLEALREFKRSMILHRRLMGALLAGDDVHPAQAGCLQMLAHHDGMSQSDIASMLHVSRPTVTSMLQRMEAAGTVTRQPDETDSRLTRVFLTDEGRRVAVRMREVLSEVLELSIGQMTEEERTELARLLRLSNDNMEKALAERGVPAHPHGMMHRKKDAE